jgi:DNA-binding GntR family transcriptional regulator
LLISAVGQLQRDREASAATSAVDRSSTVPLYVQIRRRLLSLVAGWPDPRQRFYTDDELCRMFGVARMTVRAAISEFVDNGLLVRTRGAGTYVSFRRVEERFSPSMDFMDQWAIHGRPLTLEVRAFDVVRAPDAFAAAMGLPSGAPLLLVERMRSAGGAPVSIDYRYIVPEVASAVTRESAGRHSLLDLLATAVELDHADMTIEAAHAMGAICDLLELMPGDPVLVRGLIYYDTGERPVMAGVSYYRHDQSGYSIRVPLKTPASEHDASTKRSASGGPAWGRLVHVKQILGHADWRERKAAAGAAGDSAERGLES